MYSGASSNRRNRSASSSIKLVSIYVRAGVFTPAYTRKMAGHRFFYYSQKTQCIFILVECPLFQRSALRRCRTHASSSVARIVSIISIFYFFDAEAAAIRVANTPTAQSHFVLLNNNNNKAFIKTRSSTPRRRTGTRGCGLPCGSRTPCIPRPRR